MDFSALARWPGYVFIVAAHLGMALQVGLPELVQASRNRSLAFRALLANIVVAPLLGVSMAAVLPLSPEMKIGIILLSAAPGGLLTAQFTRDVKETLPMAAALQVLLSLTALVATPLWLRLALGIATPVTTPLDRLLTRVIPLVLLPLAAGLLLRHRLPAAAERLARPITLLSTVAYVANMVMTGGARSQAVQDVGWVGVAAILLLVVANLAVGWALGGPDRRTRRVLANATSVRNAGLALVVTYQFFGNSSVDLAVAAFAMLMVPPNQLFIALEGRLHRKEVAPA